MGLQKYRADKAGECYPNGGIPWYAHWMGGPSLALIRSCVIQNRAIPPRTVYITGEPDTYFSQPAACVFKRKTIRGYVTSADDDSGMVFRALDGQGE